MAPGFQQVRILDPLLTTLDMLTTELSYEACGTRPAQSCLRSCPLTQSSTRVWERVCQAFLVSAFWLVYQLITSGGSTACLDQSEGVIEEVALKAPLDMHAAWTWKNGKVIPDFTLCAAMHGSKVSIKERKLSLQSFPRGKSADSNLADDFRGPRHSKVGCAACPN
jgi:hypothetical protein